MPFHASGTADPEALDHVVLFASCHGNSETQNANAELRKPECPRQRSPAFFILHSHSNFLIFRGSRQASGTAATTSSITSAPAGRACAANAVRAGSGVTPRPGSQAA